MTQYLILHKVRGEPSFDCAEEIEPGMWITNSGYRAYPVEKWAISANGVPELEDAYPIPEIPENWPDHFEVREPPPENKISDIASFVRGLLPKMKIHRRF